MTPQRKAERKQVRDLRKARNQSGIDQFYRLGLRPGSTTEEQKMELTMNRPMLDYSDLPEHMQGAMQRYMEHGIEPGSFLMAVLSNDLMDAFGKADHINAQFIREYCQWLYNSAPADSFGSRERVNAWMKRRVDEAA